MRLTELKKGESKRIKTVKCNQRIKRRLEDMGMVEGCKITLVRYSPFGDPIEVKVKDFHLALRKSEADKIILYDE